MNKSHQPKAATSPVRRTQKETMNNHQKERISPLISINHAPTAFMKLHVSQPNIFTYIKLQICSVEQTVDPTHCFASKRKTTLLHI